MNSVTYASSPSNTVTETDTYVAPADPGDAAWANGTAIHKDISSASVNMSGSGTSVSGSEKTTTSSSDDQHETFGITGAISNEAQADYVQSSSTTDTVEGSDNPAAGGTVSDTETDAYVHSLNEKVTQSLKGLSQGQSETLTQTHIQDDNRTVKTALSGSPPPPGSTAGETIVSATGSGSDKVTSTTITSGPGGTETIKYTSSDSWTYQLVAGAVTQPPTASTAEVSVTGNDPVTGADVTQAAYDPGDPQDFFFGSFPTILSILESVPTKLCFLTPRREELDSDRNVHSVDGTVM